VSGTKRRSEYLVSSHPRQVNPVNRSKAASRSSTWSRRWARLASPSYPVAGEDRLGCSAAAPVHGEASVGAASVALQFAGTMTTGSARWRHCGLGRVGTIAVLGDRSRRGAAKNAETPCPRVFSVLGNIACLTKKTVSSNASNTFILPRLPYSQVRKSTNGFASAGSSLTNSTLQ
jgi:hypothetical protein